MIKSIEALLEESEAGIEAGRTVSQQELKAQILIVAKATQLLKVGWLL